MAAFQRQTSRLSLLFGRVGLIALLALALCTLPGRASADQASGDAALDTELAWDRAGLQLLSQDSFLDRLVASFENDGGVAVPLLTAAVNSATIGLSALSFRAANVAAGERFASNTRVMLDFGVGRKSQTIGLGRATTGVALTIEHRFR